jgi:hypothetical protein
VDAALTAEYGPLIAHLCVAGHKWVSMGGCNCGCPDGRCSVPVCECTVCGDYDYGDNDEANAKRERCRMLGIEAAD